MATTRKERQAQKQRTLCAEYNRRYGRDGWYYRIGGQLIIKPKKS